MGTVGVPDADCVGPAESSGPRESGGDDGGPHRVQADGARADDHGQGPDHVTVGVDDAGGHGVRAERHFLTDHGNTGATALVESVPQPDRIGDGAWGVCREALCDHLVLEAWAGMREQYLADTGTVQRQPTTDVGGCLRADGSRPSRFRHPYLKRALPSQRG